MISWDRRVEKACVEILAVERCSSPLFKTCLCDYTFDADKRLSKQICLNVEKNIQTLSDMRGVARCSTVLLHLQHREKTVANIC